MYKRQVVADKSEIGAIGHRIVQGAEFFTKSEIVTDAIIDKIEEIAPLAPVHNMAHVQGLRSAKAVFGADVPNVVARGFGGRAPRTHICSDLTYVRVGASWNYVCLLVDLYNREIVGHSAGPRKDARLVKSAFATLSFPISDIEVFHTDRGSEFDNAEIDLMLEAFGIERSLSAKGCPYDNAVDESTNRILKAELVHRETFGTTRELRAKLSDYVHWYNNFRIHSTLGYMSPVEFREAGLSLPESSK